MSGTLEQLTSIVRKRAKNQLKFLNFFCLIVASVLIVFVTMCLLNFYIEVPLHWLALIGCYTLGVASFGISVYFRHISSGVLVRITPEDLSNVIGGDVRTFLNTCQQGSRFEKIRADRMIYKYLKKARKL